METLTEKFNKQNQKEVPDIHTGDSLKIHQIIKEGSKERIQIFEGIVIAQKHGVGPSGTITVRKVVEGVGVERVFPIHSPSISKIEVVKSGKVRRSKLYYLRTAKGKKSRLKKKEFSVAIAPEAPAATAAEETQEPSADPATPEVLEKAE